MRRGGTLLLAVALLSGCSILVENKLELTSRDGSVGDAGVDGSTGDGSSDGGPGDWFTHCGNGTLEPDLGEQCEPNENDPDCSAECTFTCEADEDCPTTNLCFASTCNRDTGICTRPAARDCVDDDPCTIDSCNPGMGCLNLFVDEDRDGYAPSGFGTCKDPTKSGDCNDADPTVHPGATEECDDIDHDCNGDPDPENIVILDCQADQDRDGFGNPNVTEPGCTCPPGYIQPRPDGFADCNDQNPNVFPGQSSFFTTPYCPDGTNPSGGTACTGGPPSFDYDCSGSDDVQFPSSIDCESMGRLCRGEGWAESIAGCGVEEKWTTCSARVCNPLDLFCGRDECLGSTTTQTQGCR